MESKMTAPLNIDPASDNPQISGVERLLFDNPLVRLGVVATSISSAIVAAVSTVHRQYYDGNKMKAPYGALYKERLARINANGAALDLPDGAKGKISIEAFNEERKNIEVWFRDAFEIAVEKRGIPTKGIEGLTVGTWKKAASMNAADVRKIGFSALGTLGVTMGAYFVVRKMSRYSHQLNQIDDKLDNLKARLDAKHAHEGVNSEHSAAAAPSR